MTHIRNQASYFYNLVYIIYVCSTYVCTMLLKINLMVEADGKTHISIQLLTMYISINISCKIYFLLNVFAAIVHPSSVAST